MPSRKPTVIVTRRLPDTVETRLRELFNTQLNLHDEPLSRTELIDAVGRCDVLAPTITDKIDAEVIAQAGERYDL